MDMETSQGSKYALRRFSMQCGYNQCSVDIIPRHQPNFLAYFSVLSWYGLPKYYLYMTYIWVFDPTTKLDHRGTVA